VPQKIIPSLSSENNPFALIKLFAKSSAAKALPHLNNLSQVLLSLAQSTSPSKESSLEQGQTMSSAKTALALQLLHIECQLFQQRLRPEEKPKDLGDLAGKYLAVYLRRTQSLDSKGKHNRYVVVRDTVHKTKSLLGLGKSGQLLPLELYKLASWAASDANIPSESVQWTQEWRAALIKHGDKADAALVVLCEVRLAVLELRAVRLSHADKGTPGLHVLEPLEKKVGSTAHELVNIARGRKQDLELLLQEVAQLRRNSLGLLTSLPNEGRRNLESSSPVDPAERMVRKICDQSFKSVVQFCRKYMSMGISEDELGRLQSILAPAIDTVLSALFWGFDTEDPESWENAEVSLGECWSAINSVERVRPGQMDAMYDKLSNVYWQIFLLYRKSSGSEMKAVRALRSSISAMNDRPVPELIQASLVRKWETLGSIYLGARDYRRAEEAFTQTVATASAIGLLNELGERASGGQPIHQLIDNSGRDIVSVGVALSGLVRIANKKKDREAAELRFRIDGLSTSARGCLLEWCFSLALDQITDDGSVVRVLGERLVDIYDLEEMPIRRARVVVNLLEASVDHPGLLAEEAVRSLAEEVLEWANGDFSHELDEDRDLETFKDDIIARCCMGLAFSHWLDDASRPVMTGRAIGLWGEILRQEGTWDAIQRRIDRPENMIKRLEMAVEYFDMRAEHDQKLAALGLLLDFRKLETSINYDGKPRHLVSLQRMLTRNCF
jgi:separase